MAAGRSGSGRRDTGAGGGGGGGGGNDPVLPSAARRRAQTRPTRDRPPRRPVASPPPQQSARRRGRHLLSGAAVREPLPTAQCRPVPSSVSSVPRAGQCLCHRRLLSVPLPAVCV